MKNEEIKFFESLRYNHSKKYWFCAVPTTIRRSGELKVSDKKYNRLKLKYETQTNK